MVREHCVGRLQGDFALPLTWVATPCVHAPAGGAARLSLWLNVNALFTAAMRIPLPIGRYGAGKGE